MKTDELIRALSVDLAIARPPPERSFAAAMVPGLSAAIVLFATILGPRPDFASALGEPRFLFKFVITLLLVLCSAALVRRLVRPGQDTKLQMMALVIFPIVLAAGVAAELMALPRPSWTKNMIGINGAVCLMSIPLFALPILIAALFALRDGAPTRPTLTGGVAGLFAGAMGAAIYAAHCPDDSPLFVALWYSLAIAAVAAVGAAAGRFVLRW
jgi:hypothetical protein